MKMRNGETLRSQEGARRVRRKFLIMPRSFGGSVTRWLEHADIVEQVCRVDTWFCITGEVRSVWEWREVGFKNGGE